MVERKAPPKSFFRIHKENDKLARRQEALNPHSAGIHFVGLCPTRLHGEFQED
jgi:hypothetical protein